MGRNSHNFTINEDQKPFTRKITDLDYDFAVLSRSEFISKYGITDNEYEGLWKK